MQINKLLTNTFFGYFSSILDFLKIRWRFARCWIQFRHGLIHICSSNSRFLFRLIFRPRIDHLNVFSVSVFPSGIFFFRSVFGCFFSYKGIFVLEKPILDSLHSLKGYSWNWKVAFKTKQTCKNDWK